MKKILSAILVATALMGCNKENTLDSLEQPKIGFGYVFVNNTTKAAATDLSTANLTEFSVFGALTVNSSTGKIFENDRVYKNASNDFVYDNTQYWIPNTQYHFTAIAPYQTGNAAAWTYTTSEAQNGTITYDASSDIDLLFAYVKPEKTAEKITTQPEKVGFTFNHLLSRARFTFVNNVPEISNITFKITDVKILDAYKVGTIAVSNGVAGDWAAETNNNTYDVSFANAATIIPGEADNVTNYESTEHHYILPVAKKLNVSFKLEIFQAGVSLGIYDRATTVDITPEKGMSYDIKANLTVENALPNAIYPIEFKVNAINDWAEYTNVDAGDIVTNN